MRDDELNILDICSQGTRALGPGFRYALWTQGCPFNCKNCISPESHSTEPNLIVDIQSLAEDIISNRKIEGLSISGGEPFIQAGKLSVLLSIVKQHRPDLNVLCFTGYVYDELNWPDALSLLSHIDLLIDGRFQSDKNEGIGLRGSSNQSFIFLSDALLPYREELEKGPRKLEMYIGNKDIKTIGIPTKC